MRDKKGEIHIIFFHGLGDDYKYANNYAKYIENSYKGKGHNIYTHAHEYPTAFQNYQTYVKVSFLFFGISILAPIIMIACSQSIMMIGLASLAALICFFLSMALIAVSLIYRDQKLFKSSIDKIEKLIEEGVESEKIILLGHSFGGVTVSEVLKHFANKNITLGGVIFANAFSSFEKVIKYLPMFQLRILNLLPSFLSQKLLKALDIDFNVVRDLRELQSKESFNIPIVIINNESDNVVPLLAQLKYAVESKNTNEENTLSPENENIIKTLSTGYPTTSHTAVLYGHELDRELTDLMVNKVDKTTSRESYKFG
ncbi:alpha/beta hydrolase [Wolbachia endosymbiont of Ctenocephalides felis wCfeT]|uniref:alpha/beta hydrolase n=1 Tax=Wolbachia endosymbiont of Ctenocephalides felis wCfeT TaxID=2732593 RepID=UPI001447A70E|nr:alpha/beta hydrolase [Wolbachia endosymbiont of Ctenocephalides felis wCfeT]